MSPRAYNSLRSESELAAYTQQPVDELKRASAPTINTPRLTDGEKICEIGRVLLAGDSLNLLNREVLQLLVRATEKAPVSKPALAALREWTLFAVSNQNYFSPSRESENAVFQDGVVRPSEHVRYLRSEMNAQVFGGGYDKNVVVVRAESVNSFAELAARYVTCSESRHVIAREFPNKSFAEIYAEGCTGMGMILVDLGAENAEDLVTKLMEAVRADPEALGAYYLRVKGAVNPNLLSSLEKSLMETGSPIHVVIEEDFNPLQIDDSQMRRIALIHNQRDPTRYQLIQDAASMGYRVELKRVIANYFDAGRLPEILNTKTKSQDHISCGYSDVAVEAEGAARLERDRDYQVILNTLAGVRSQLQSLVTSSGFVEDILALVRREAAMLEVALQSILSDDSKPLSEVRQTFHSSYYRLRCLVQYTARLSNELGFESREGLEERIAAIEGGQVIATKSGMSAARSVVMYLGARVGHIYTGPHYWETDFLIENSFSKNPHYPEYSGQETSRVSFVPHDLDEIAIQKKVSEIVARSKVLSGGQLVCLDKSIAPFFYTRSFNLERLTAALAERAGEIGSPIYLVVDNTLDLKLSSESLFPGGVPKNVFLIFTPSQAKLHQLGFDFTTGGMIEIHANQGQRDVAKRLRAELTEILSHEGSLQEAYELRLLMSTYYDRSTPRSFEDYYDFMVIKRQRNTHALVSSVADGLKAHTSAAGHGEWNSLKSIEIKDPEYPSLIHKLDLSLHYDPQSSLLAYIKLLEPQAEKYIAGRIFDEIKRRVFKIAGAEGIQLGDGTSWGFPTTRFDWYMHTLRVAVGLEHSHNLSRLGAIISSVLKELIEYPEEFLSRIEVSPMVRCIRDGRIDQVMKLDRLIPQDRATPPEYYLESRSQAWDFSFVVENGGQLEAMLYAWPEEHDGERVIYLSKAATDPQGQGKRYFRRMLEHLKDKARAEGISRLVLKTSASQRNIGVVRAYEKCGFEGSAVEGRMLANGWPLFKVLMELDLKKSERPTPFAPIPEEVYNAVYARGNLAEAHSLMTYRFRETGDTSKDNVATLL